MEPRDARTDVAAVGGRIVGVTGSDRHEQIVRCQDPGPVEAAKRQEKPAHLDLHTDMYV